MRFSNHPLLKSVPAVLMMIAIFLFSARPSIDEPSNIWLHIISKAGHVIGYAMLTLSLWRGFAFNAKRIWLAWLLALLYAITDEYHQSFVPGRHPAFFDVVVYDNLGALISVWFAGRFSKQKQPVGNGLVVNS